jgi:cholesterol transport system auxiliary component
MSPLPRRLVLAGLALAPTACSVLPTGGAPPKLYTLTPASDFPPAGRPVRWQLLVDAPVTTAALDSERIALSRSPTTVDYFADAAWTDRAPLMVQTVIVQSFENSGRITAIARESVSLRADYQLRPELRHFEADYGAGAAPRARVQLGVKLVKMSDRAIIAQQMFEASVPARENQVPAIVDAFNAALQQVARQVVDWTLSSAGAA